MKRKLSTSSRSVLNSGLTEDYRKAIAEYIWNGFDAGATCVEIRYTANPLGGVDDLWVIDNGSGIKYETLDLTFGAFLDSHKTQTYQRSSEVRGRKGKGRFSYNVISGGASWQTKFKDEHGNLKPQYEYQRLQEQIASYRKDCVELETEIQQLKAEQKDNQYFISALQGKIEALDRSIATRDYFDSLHLEYCPECLTKIDDNVDEGHCRLCKSPVDNSKGKTQAIRIRLELDFQIRESRLLMQANENLFLEKEALLKTKQQLLATAQQQYDNAVKNVRSSQDEQIDQLIQEIGYKEGDINQYRTMLEQAERYERLQKQMEDLKTQEVKLRKYIQAAEYRIEQNKKAIKRSISANGVYMLKNDQDRQTEFMQASDFEVDYKQNLAYISNQRIKLSASSEFYLKMAARFALLFASMQVPSMMYPRLMFSDNMEDKGMEEERAKNFQRMIVKRLNELATSSTDSKHSTLNYQLIFATSNIAEELNTAEYVVGDYYTQSNKSLKNV